MGRKRKAEEPKVQIVNDIENCYRIHPVNLTPEEEAKRNEFLHRLETVPPYELPPYDMLLRTYEYQHHKISKEDGLKEMELLKIYHKQFEQSEGFDIDVHPKIGLPPGYIFPGEYTEKELNTYFKKLANLAIGSYSTDNKRNWQVLKVEKVNDTESVVHFFRVTFTAKDGSSRYRSPRTFQAIVSVTGICSSKHRPPRVELCRLKPKK